MATGDPAMSEEVYQRARSVETPSQAMTLHGAVLKMALLLAILLATASYTWSQVVAGSATVTGLGYCVGR